MSKTVPISAGRFGEHDFGAGDGGHVAPCCVSHSLRMPCVSLRPLGLPPWLAVMTSSRKHLLLGTQTIVQLAGH